MIPLLNTDMLIDHTAAPDADSRPLFILTMKDCAPDQGTVPDSETVEQQSADKWPDAVPESVRALAKLNGFTGKIGSVLSHKDGVLVGAGNGSDDFAIAAAASLPTGYYRLAYPALSGTSLERTLLGWLLGGYKFDRYKTAPSPSAVLIAPRGADIDRIRRLAKNTSFVRDLINTPAGDMLPTDLEDTTRKIAEESNATMTVTRGEALLTDNFPMVHAVGRASANAPRLIDLQWTHDNAPDTAPRVTIVGKGVCFDSGGLNIKGAGGMSLMKKDMGGAAHALGLGQLIMGSKLPVRLRVLIPAVENAISGSAFRPGDVLQTRKGLTVEIGNTDAEGRLILGDTMTYACEHKPDLLITLATLTGAARVALGPEVIPFYTDDVTLAHAMKEASADTQDPAWHMPMWPNYEKMLASPVADLNNISGNSFAGSILAALFLRRFIPAGQRWLHFDLYGWRPGSEPGRPQGGEAQCLRALFTLIERQVAR